MEHAVRERRRKATAHLAAVRYLKNGNRVVLASALHSPSEMPNIGDRVLNIEWGSHGEIHITFENGENVTMATGIHWDASGSDLRDWQEQKLKELAEKKEKDTFNDVVYSLRKLFRGIRDQRGEAITEIADEATSYDGEIKNDVLEDMVKSIADRYVLHELEGGPKALMASRVAARYLAE